MTIVKNGMEKGLNFRTLESQQEYFDTYEQSVALIDAEIEIKYVSTSFGESHVICCGDENSRPLVLLHAASCGSPIWYKNIPEWAKRFRVYAIDLIGESSESIMKKKMKNPEDNAKWLDETVTGLGLQKFVLCGLSIGGWNSANYASRYPQRVEKLILMSPVQTFAKMHLSYFFRIMKMGFKPTRENVESYIGWGSAKEEPLPDSIIRQFTISVMNMNSNASFPKWIKKQRLANINMPTLIMFGENEFAFSLKKAEKRIKSNIADYRLETVAGASHLLPVSKAEYINKRVIEFINQ